MSLNSTQKHSVLHLIFVHGFRGDRTSFQRFPTHIHEALQDSVPRLQSHIYPTYKSRQILQHSVEQLMGWIKSLDPGYIVLFGHSLGGFLVAEAAMQYPTLPGRSQIIGVIACDVPYLGIHPHVIVSGIASLFPNKGAESESTMNDSNKVNMVDYSDNASLYSGNRSSSPASPMAGSPKSTISRFSEMSVAPMIDLAPGPSMWENTLHFFKKHADDPLHAIKNWTVSHWEHGSILLDPDELRNRYKRFERWQGGDWINFYTETVPPKATNDPAIVKELTTTHSESTLNLRAVQSNPGIPSASQNLTTHPNLSTPNLDFPVPQVAPDAGTSGIQDQSVTLPSLSTYPELKKQIETMIDVSAENPNDPNEVTFPVPMPYPPPDIVNEAAESIQPKSETSSTRPSTDAPALSIKESDADTIHTTAAQTPGGIIPPDPLPHPPLSPQEQKAHDKANDNEARKLVKQNKAEAKAREKEEKQRLKAQEAEIKAQEKEARRKAKEQAESAGRKSPSPPRRFIITPFSNMSMVHWERVPVAGALHEVDAHCGIFFPNKNLEYEAFVERVADVILDWSRKRTGILA